MKPILLLPALFIATALHAAETPGAATLAEANRILSEGKPAEALALFERVFEQSGKVDDWYSAQKGIVLALAKKGDIPAALQASRICLDGAPTLRQYDESVQLAAGLLSAMDQNVTRANAYLEFQTHGKGDDPIRKIAYATYPEREKIFDQLRAETGQTPAGSRTRAWTFLYTGKPREAEAHFADAFRRASATQDLQNSATDLVVIALRNQRGNAAGIESEIEPVLSGGKGDLLPPPAPPAGQGGLAEIAPDQVAALKKTGNAATLYAGDVLLRPDVRRAAFMALLKCNEAADNWGAPGQAGWFFQLAASPEINGVEDVLFAGAAASAKGRGLDLAGMASFWEKITETRAANQLPPTKGMESARKQFDGLCANLRKITPRKLKFKPLVKPASY